MSLESTFRLARDREKYKNAVHGAIKLPNCRHCFANDDVA